MGAMLLDLVCRDRGWRKPSGTRLTLAPHYQFQEKGGEHSHMFRKSILAKGPIQDMLQRARENKELVGEVQPMLFLMVGGRAIIMPVDLPDTSEKRMEHFRDLGRQLRRRGIIPSEAVLLSEGWFVFVPRTPAAFDFPVSEHPARQEAIFIIGLDIEGKRVTQVVQPMLASVGKRPTWQPLEFEAYNTKGEGELRPYGLLDAFFVGLKQG